MKIGVVSDTHGHIENLQKAIKALEGMGAQVICHLGDDYDDLKAVQFPRRMELVQVPGVFSTYYRDPEIPNRVVREWEGKRFLLTHTRGRHENDLPTDPDPQELVSRHEVDVVLYGHSHIPDLKEEEGVLWINPGHLKDEDKKGYPPTFALISLEGSDLQVKVFELYSLKELLSYP